MPNIDDAQIEPGTGKIYFGANMPPVASGNGSLTQTASLNPATFSVLGNNLGSGFGIYSGYSGGSNSTTLNFKSFVAGPGIAILESSDYITLESSGQFVGLNDAPGTIVPNALIVGAANNLLEFTPAPSAANQILQWNGSTFIWTTVGAGSVQSIDITSGYGIDITGTNGPITSTGSYQVSLLPSGIASGTYTAATVYVDNYGRIISAISNNFLANAENISNSQFPIFANISSDTLNFNTLSFNEPISATNSAGIIDISFSTSGVSAGSYSFFSVNQYGLITSASDLLYSQVVSALGYVPLSGTITSSATPNSIVERDSTGNINATSFTGSLIGNALTATSLLNPQTIAFSGAITGNGIFSGSQSLNIFTSIAQSGVTVGTYNTVSVEADGRVISGFNIPTLLTGAVIGSGQGTITTALAPSGVTAGTYTAIVVNSSGIVVSGGNITSANIVSALGYTPINPNELGVANGIATLGSNGLLNIPSGVSAGTYSSVVVNSAGIVISGGNSSTTLGPSGVSAGTYTKVVVDVQGIVTSASEITSTDIITGLGYTPINETAIGSTVAALASPNFTGTPTAPTPLLTDNSTEIATTAYVQGQSYIVGNQIITLTGDATGSGATSIDVVLVPTGVSAGTYNSVVVDITGRVITASNVTSTTDVTLSGDVTGSGVGSITTTLSPSGVSAGTYSKVVVNAKGLVIASALLDNTDIIDGLGYTPINETAIGSTVAALASPNFTGTPTAPTPISSDASSSIATTNFVKQQNYLTTNKTITISGDATGSGTTAITLVLNNTGVTAGTYSSVVVDAKGLVISGSNAIAPGVYQFQVSFDGSGNISTITNLPSGWTSVLTNSNEFTITHNLGSFPFYISCFGYNNGIFTMKSPNGFPTGQFSVGITSTTTTPNTFTLYGVNSTAVNAAVSSYMIVQVLI